LVPAHLLYPSVKAIRAQIKCLHIRVVELWRNPVGCPFKSLAD